MRKIPILVIDEDNLIQRTSMLFNEKDKLPEPNQVIESYYNENLKFYNFSFFPNENNDRLNYYINNELKEIKDYSDIEDYFIKSATKLVSYIYNFNMEGINTVYRDDPPKINYLIFSYKNLYKELFDKELNIQIENKKTNEVALLDNLKNEVNNMRSLIELIDNINVLNKDSKVKSINGYICNKILRNIITDIVSEKSNNFINNPLLLDIDYDEEEKPFYQYSSLFENFKHYRYNDIKDYKIKEEVKQKNKNKI